MICSSCEFTTPRLDVSEWHSPRHHQRDLDATVASILTPAVTEPLPPSWHGRYPPDRARKWIDERDAEGPCLLVVERESREPVGLVILFESDVADGVEVRLGYLLAEGAWGRGLASELVGGFVAWCREQSALGSIVAGVETTNPASAEVLLKNGFVATNSSPPHEAQLYELSLLGRTRDLR